MEGPRYSVRAESAPVRDRVRGHFGAVVHAHEFRAAVDRDQALEGGHEVIHGHGPFDVDR